MSSPATSNSIPIVKSPGTPTGNHTGGGATQCALPIEGSPLPFSPSTSQGRGASTASTPTIQSPLSHLSAQPLTRRNPSKARWAHPQGEGPKGLRYPDEVRPSLCPAKPLPIPSPTTLGTLTGGGATLDTTPMGSLAPLPAPLCPATYFAQPKVHPLGTHLSRKAIEGSTPTESALS